MSDSTNGKRQNQKTKPQEKATGKMPPRQGQMGRGRRRPNRARRAPPKKQSEPAQDKLLHAAGQRGTDIRAPQKQTTQSVQKNLIVTGYVNTLPVTAECVDRSISYTAMGIVLHAMRNGYQWKNQASGVSPYGAFLRIISVIRSFMDGAEPLITNAPAWFWNLCSALRPKVVPFKTGYIRYDWNFYPSGAGNDVVFQLSTSPNHSLYWGVPGLSETSVNGFPILQPPPDTSENAQIESLQDLFGWFNSRGHPLVQSADLYMDRDTSAFAACYPELGSSWFSPGGVKTTMYSERQVDCPILAKYATYQPFTESAYRGWQKGGVSAGSTCYIGARVPELTTVDEWRNKTSPTFKFYNFDEFFETLSFALGMALENINSTTATAIPITACPLTPFQVQMILRQTLIPFFNNEMAQDLRYEGQWEEFVPFTVGPNGVAAGQYSMQLPMLLAENIRAVSRITGKLKSRVAPGRQIQDIIPVLGRFSNRSQLGNYTYTLGENNSFVYAEDPTELPVDLVDLSAVVDQSTVFLDANGQNTANLITIWNEWIVKLSSVLSGLVPMVPAPSCSALVTNVYTNLQVSIEPPGENQQASTTAITSKKLPFKKTKYGSAPVSLKQSTVQAVNGTSYFNRVADIRLSAQLGIYDALAPFIKVFILPVNKPLDAESFSTSFQSVQAWQVEPGFLNRSSALGESTGPATYVTQVSAESRHRQMAALDVKQVISDGDNAVISDLRKLQKAGEGGFFTAIADIIGGVTGIPLGPVARMIEGSQ